MYVHSIFKGDLRFLGLWPLGEVWDLIGPRKRILPFIGY